MVQRIREDPVVAASLGIMAACLIAGIIAVVSTVYDDNERLIIAESEVDRVQEQLDVLVVIAEGMGGVEAALNGFAMRFNRYDDEQRRILEQQARLDENSKLVNGRVAQIERDVDSLRETVTGLRVQGP